MRRFSPSREIGGRGADDLVQLAQLSGLHCRVGEGAAPNDAINPFVGRKAIGDAFGGYLANFETVYHINGQQTVDLNGDTATGTAYCLVVLIADENGRKIKNTAGVAYHDEYVRRDGQWLIGKRTSYFIWRDRGEMAAD